jgi:hypothetical protein
VTAAQRLRLVLALGVINLVLASVALGIGITGAPFATPGIAVVEPTATPPTGAGAGGSPATSNATSPTTPEPTARPGGPGPSSSTEPPSPTAPTVSPSPSVVEPLPSAIPTEAPAPTSTAAVPTPRPVLAGNPGATPPSSGSGGGGSPPRSTPQPSPKPTPTPNPPAKPTPAPTPVVKPPPKPPSPACHASARGIEASRGKACGVHGTAHPNKPGRHKATTRPRHHADRQPAHAQPATVESKRRSRASRHRLRPGHRPQ